MNVETVASHVSLKSQPADVAKLYRVSALASGFVHMWRGWRVIVPVVIVNALLQSLLVAVGYSVDAVIMNAIFAAISGLFALVSLVIITVAAIHACSGVSTWAQVVAADRRSIGTALLWGMCIGIAVTVGLSFWTVPGIVILALTSFVMIAAVAGERNPLAANFRVIGRRFWRWLITALITNVVMVLGALGSGFVVFFLRGMLGAGVVWLATGLLAAWFITTWGLIYNHSVQRS